MKELEDVLRSSEEERRRLEMERGKEEELFSRALAVTNESEKTDQKREGLTATSSSRTEATPLVTKNAELKATSEGAASKSSNTVEGSETVGSAGSADSKPSRAATAKKDRRESTGERPPTMNTLAPSERDRRASVGDKSPTTKTSAPPEKTPPRTRGNGRPPTAKRGNTPSGGVGERAALKSVKDRRPSTEARKPKEDDLVNTSARAKTEAELEDEGMMYGPRGKNIYDVNVSDVFFNLNCYLL
ncbi:hypothetical protein OSTOST_12945 [Ostertagia ostertagi]